MKFSRLKDVDIRSNIGNQLNISFLALETTIRPQKDKGRFMSIVMGDKDARHEAKIFSIDDKIERDIVSGRAYDAVVEVKSYKDSYSCIISSIQESKIPKEEFMDWVEGLEELKEQLKLIINNMESTVYKDIVTQILMSNYEKFCTWPAGRSQHHTQLGGLLLHTISVTRVAISIAAFYNKLYEENIFNIDLLKAACLLHDLGKIVEYEIDGSVGKAKFTADAALSSHIMESLKFIDALAVAKNIMDSEEVKILKHCIAAHHGKLEWGSPIMPATPEALLLHRIDMIDADVSVFNKEFKDLKPGESKTIWSNNSTFTSFYKDKSKVKNIEVDI